MKVPQFIAIAVLVLGLGFVALKRGGEAPEEVPATVVAEPEPIAPPVPAPAAERPVFRGPHDGSHVYQGVLCPACERGPVEF